MNLLNVEGVVKKAGNSFVLKDISFVQQEFQKIAIAGETGSGKSTLLKIIAGFIQPDEGRILLGDERVLGPEEKLIAGHSRIAYLSQHFELRNNYRVEELLEMANKISEKEAEMIFRICQVDHLLRRRTDQLSGGEKQRIATARLLITSPKLLLLDEPYSNLDTVHKKVLKSVIQDISDQLKITCMMVSHDPLDSLSWADEIIVMKDGQILQKGAPEHIYTNPINEYSAGLFGPYNLLSAEQVEAFGVPAISQSGVRIVARPEHFKVVANERQAVMGEVIKVRFFGSYYEIEVMLQDQLITMKTDELFAAEGDLVYISLRVDKVGYL